MRRIFSIATEFLSRRIHRLKSGHFKDPNTSPNVSLKSGLSGRMNRGGIYPHPFVVSGGLFAFLERCLENEVRLPGSPGKRDILPGPSGSSAGVVPLPGGPPGGLRARPPEQRLGTAFQRCPALGHGHRLGRREAIAAGERFFFFPLCPRYLTGRHKSSLGI
ncbi:hypothetical protein AVEN_218379-1 [Araneus ventricosus]|uniref:Uncharacterized protein n=1 Tax=Araneus ventricosus TaxID=182803 RepID=A0A4Y2QVH1_ARAVE|nr:hypothetical protein AVEN_218379-1 [Araneus ventricosus]